VCVCSYSCSLLSFAAASCACVYVELLGARRAKYQPNHLVCTCVKGLIALRVLIVVCIALRVLMVVIDGCAVLLIVVCIALRVLIAVCSYVRVDLRQVF